MQNIRLGVFLFGAVALASCAQQSTPAASSPEPQVSVAAQIAEFAQRPELQDADSQAILKQYASDPGMLDALQRAYGLKADEAFALDEPEVGLTQLDGRLDYVRRVAWGSVSNYQAAKAHPAYSGLRWGSDGCSAPSGVGLGYRDTFRPACDVHDFGYGNLPRLTPKSSWEGQRKNTDVAFHNNMKSICGRMSFYKKPPCYVAAQAYYTAVRNFGDSHWK